MSCAGKGYGKKSQSNDYLNAQFYSSIVVNEFTSKTNKTCKKYRNVYPSFTPILGSLSNTSSPEGAYSLVYVDGSNFLPNGTTFIKFGNYGYIPVTYYSSFSLSFVVPLNASSGSYNVQVVNLYNGNFSPQVNPSYPGNLNFSGSIIYTIT
jgi:hypothetical protein